MAKSNSILVNDATFDHLKPKTGFWATGSCEMTQLQSISQSMFMIAVTVVGTAPMRR
jgi:hypothetical protein